MRVLSCMVLLCALVAPAAAGELAPGLADQLDRLPADAEVRVLVVLDEQVDAPALARDLLAAKAGHREIHRRVVDALQQTAVRSQADLLAELGAIKTAGGIRAFRPHWLINAVVVTGSAAAVRELAADPRVARVEPDLVAEPIAPVATLPAAAPADVGVGDGVAAIGAPRVWHELGIDGTGVLVGIIDTGMDGNHPALSDRWRGNFAPAAECWLDAAQLGDTDFPVDRRDHGTHVLGIVTGQAAGDSIGVAPGALWIGTNGVNHPGTDADFDNAILASLEFMTDPDGDPATSDDVPAVVHNSWGVHAGFTGYFDCDSRWWDAVDACEAAGVVLTWSVGNEGPDAGTIRSPADRATTATNCFAVGATTSLPPYVVADFSSRGPSACGGAHEIKPEIVAPGVDIRSAEPGGGYQILSGTSMAGPHVAGVVALMRQANPEADVASIKQVLMDTALDLGPTGEDNDSGHGLVDAYAAVSAIKAGVGTVSGLVTDATTSLPVVGARVRLTGSLAQDTTDADGRYLMTLPAGPTTLVVTAFGYADGEVSLTIPDGGSATGDHALAPLPTTTISGHVRDEAGGPLTGATVTVLDTPLPPAPADATGAYVLTVPVVPGRIWLLRAEAVGYRTQDRTVTAPAPVTVDFDLTQLTLEDFETGDFSARPWQHAGAEPWGIATDVVWRGQYSARSGAGGDGATSELSLTSTALAADEVAFHLRVSSEAGYDQLQFFVDGVVRSSWSGEVPWTRYSLPVTAGSHVYRWVYAKDAAGSAGQDAAWIDDVVLPPPGQLPAPELVVTPSAVLASAPSDAYTEAWLKVDNPGHADLTFSLVGLAPAAKSAAATVPHADLDKGATDPRTGTAVLTAGGGPDGSGRIWTDSDQPGGPEFAWVDIAATGTDVGAGDDEVFGPFDLGFELPWFGATRNQVWISSNGFLAFAPSGPEHANQGLPDPAAPNDLLALFWDDLDPSAAGAVLVRSEPGRFIVQFDGVAHYGAAAATETFQALLEADGTILYQYLEVGDDGGCSVGLENAAGDDGLQVVFNRAGYLRDGLAVRFAPTVVPAWLGAVPPAATVPPGVQVDVRLTMDTAGLGGGDHLALLHVASNDPAAALVTVPLTLTVGDLAGDGSPLPSATDFAGAVPNPFNPVTRLQVALPQATRVELKIYDVAGRLVRVVHDGPLPAGRHRLPWDGRDGNGRAAASGVYFARMRSAGFSRTHSLVLVR